MFSLARFVYHLVTYQFFNLYEPLFVYIFTCLIIELWSFIWAEVIRSFFSCAVISFHVLNVLCYVLFHCPVLCRIWFHQWEVPWSYLRPLTHVHLIFINIGFDNISISGISISAVRINISIKYLNSYQICLLSRIPIVDGTFSTM